MHGFHGTKGADRMAPAGPMRTTLDIEDDVLAAAKELARRQGTSAGESATAATANLEQQLSEEARLSRQPRSQLIREALETLLSQGWHERAQAALKQAAVALTSDAGACEEPRELAAPAC